MNFQFSFTVKLLNSKHELTQSIPQLLPMAIYISCLSRPYGFLKVRGTHNSNNIHCILFVNILNILLLQNVFPAFYRSGK